jgi:hypothetical protein
VAVYSLSTILREDKEETRASETRTREATEKIESGTK